LPNVAQVLMKSLSLQDILISLTAFDIAIYNLGDNYLLHGNIFAVSRRHPGIVILHDLVMHHFFSGYYFVELKDQPGYVDELAFAHGQAGRELGQRILAGKMGNVWESETMLQFHMAKAALHGTLGVVTHSEFARREVELFAAYPVTHINFPTPKIFPKSRKSANQDGKIRFLSFGMLNSNKMIDRVIDAIGESSILRERVIYDVIGSGNDDYIKLLHQRIQQQHLEGKVMLHGYQADEVLQRYIQQADVIINLRNPYFGEASWVMLEAAFSAKPTLVWKHGYYDEYPDDTVVKVTSATLLSSLERVATDEALLVQLSKNIRDYALQTFITERYIQQLLEFIGQVRRQIPILQLTDTVSRYIQEIDPQLSDLSRQVAREISHLLPDE
jgi:glycosyltransferase involved in cell wall biosynthesis